MTKFSQTLSDIIKNKKTPVYAVAKKCGIDRSHLSRVLTGERKLSPEAFGRLAETLELTPSEDRKLRLFYVAENFGDHRYGKYVDFINKLSRLDEAFAHVKETKNGIRISLDFEGNILTFSDPLETANALGYVVKKELTENNERSRIYTNLPSKIIFPILRKSTEKLPSGFDFRHLIAISNEKEYDLDVIFNIVRFMDYGCITRYYNAPSSPEEHIDLLYPYYVITREFTFLISVDFERSFIVRNEEFADENAEAFIEKEKNTKKYVNIYDDVLDCKENCKEIHSLGFDTLMTFGTFCATLYMSEDMWEQIAKSDLPGREYLIKSTYEYYQTFGKAFKNISYVYTKESIDEFVRTGIVKNIPIEYAVPLTPENREKVLAKFKKAAMHDNFRVVKDGYLGSIKNVSIEVYKNETGDSQKHLTFFSETENAPTHYLGNVGCNIDEQNTIEDFLEFTRYFLVSGACYNSKESLDIIDDAIEKCKGMK
ncbi:MAG: helix-turn-helix domain-containing protein [Clostridia bacterium]|nr:helix-turn-helix domain-containing protein [Clostridia bacterium]